MNYLSTAFPIVEDQIVKLAGRQKSENSNESSLKQLRTKIERVRKLKTTAKYLRFFDQSPVVVISPFWQNLLTAAGRSVVGDDGSKNIQKACLDQELDMQKRSFQHSKG